jgi:monoamine oxidase
LNLLYLLASSGPFRLSIIGVSNEKFHVRGGNDLWVKELAARLPGQIQTGRRLTKIVRTGDGGYDLTFENGTAKADYVVLALPFSILRTSVDFSQAGFQPLKTLAIQSLGMGTNSKLTLQFQDRHWESLGATGETYSDRGYQSSWEVSRATGRGGPAG